MNESKAMIMGLAGQALTAGEEAFFRRERPWGFILFARNVGEADALCALVQSLRECVGWNAPVFIDQEGGRVQRLRPPLAPNYPPARAIGALHGEAGRRAAWLLSRLHAFDLGRYGIDADCLPVLDVPVAGSHDVIGDRAYATAPEIVADLGEQAARGLLDGGVLPVIKHVPGHGRAFADSHKELPRVDAPLEALRSRDFVPFRALSAMPMAMTAHVVYTALDAAAPATTSSRVIADIIRGEIGFDGLLMSDDVSMKALSGDFGARTHAILAAGCDLVLHCNGDLAEMQAVAEATPSLQGKARQRADRALAMRGHADGAGEAELRREFAAMFEAVA
jgi:beta-N-acetylhexosaminidase